MALEHALLVALSEQPASGLDLAKRFSRSIGFFWHATHQQIYRVLGRMDADGWVERTEIAQVGRPNKLVYAVTPAGAAALATWLAEPTTSDPLRSDLAVKLRGASFGDRGAVLQRARSDGADGRPHEVQLYRFANQDSIDAYLADHRRVALADERDRVVARTELFPVALL